MSLLSRLIFFCKFCWNDSARTPFPATCLPYTYGSLPPAARFTQLFSQSLSSHNLCSCLDVLSTTNHLCNFWHNQFQQVSTYAFCSWDVEFLRKNGVAVLPLTCASTPNPESLSTLSTNTSIEWNLYLSWSKLLVTSFSLEVNVGGFSQHQKKTSDTDMYKRYFFTARVSQVNVNAMKRIYEQRSELQVAQCLKVHVLSSSYNVSRLQLRNKRKATQQWNFCVANDIVLNQVGVYHERGYADNVVNKFWFVRSFSSQHYTKFIANITSENVFQIRTK